MSDPYCPSCYRVLSSETAACPSCRDRYRPASAISRILLILGVAGLPLLIAGMLTFNVRLCIAGTAISGIAAVLHAGLQAR